MSIESTQSKLDTAVGPEEWVERYGDCLYQFAKRRLRATSDAEEAVQETFLSAIRAQSQFSGSGSQRSWLIGILRNKIMDVMRQREKHDDLTARELADDPSMLLFDSQGRWRPGVWSTCPGEQTLKLQELWQIVKQCLAQLPPHYANVFVLSVIDEMDAESICRELNITLTNVGVRLHRARLGIANCVRNRWFPPDESDDTN